MIRLLSVLVMSLACQTAHAFPTYASGDGFRGAELMTPEERKAHVARLQAMLTVPECQAYMEAHEAELQRRATAGNATLPAKGGDPCAVMRFFGRIR